MLTDSGGFQIFSLEPKVERRGRHLPLDLRRQHPPPDARSRRSTSSACSAPTSRWCSTCARPLPATDAVVRAAVERTAPGPPGPGRLPGRSRRRARPTAQRSQAQFGIVQGGVDLDLRARERRADASRSASTATASAACRWASRGTRCCRRSRRSPSVLPADQPRYLMGVGDPVGFVEGIARGVDMFDCVLPTRLARHGTILTDAGRLNLRNAEHARSAGPARPGLRLPGVRPLVAGLPAPPAAGAGADRGPAAHHPQPALVPRAHAPGPGGHPRPARSTAPPGRDRGRSGPETGRDGRCRVRSCARRAWTSLRPDPRLTCRRALRHRPSGIPWAPSSSSSCSAAAVGGADRPAPARAPAPQRRWWPSLAVGDEVMTGAGIYGTITDLERRRRAGSRSRPASVIKLARGPSRPRSTPTGRDAPTPTRTRADLDGPTPSAGRPRRRRTED